MKKRTPVSIKTRLGQGRDKPTRAILALCWLCSGWAAASAYMPVWTAAHGLRFVSMAGVGRSCSAGIQIRHCTFAEALDMGRPDPCASVHHCWAPDAPCMVHMTDPLLLRRLFTSCAGVQVRRSGPWGAPAQQPRLATSRCAASCRRCIEPCFLSCRAFPPPQPPPSGESA